MLDPKNHEVNFTIQQAARKLAKEEGIKFTEALRKLRKIEQEAKNEDA